MWRNCPHIFRCSGGTKARVSGCSRLRYSHQSLSSGRASVFPVSPSPEKRTCDGVVSGSNRAEAPHSRIGTIRDPYSAMEIEVRPSASSPPVSSRHQRAPPRGAGSDLYVAGGGSDAPSLAGRPKGECSEHAPLHVARSDRVSAYGDAPFRWTP